MCGIIGILRPCPADEQIPALDGLGGRLEAAADRLAQPARGKEVLAVLEESCRELAALELELRGGAGSVALRRCGERPRIFAAANRLGEQVARFEERFDRGELGTAAALGERFNRGLVGLKDVVWAIRFDRLATCERSWEMAPGIDNAAGIAALLSIQQALQAIDRMEVRGRDSAGLHLLISDHGLADDEVEGLIAERGDALFRRGTVRRVPGALSLVYKVAAEIGELGDNVRELRRQLQADALLRTALAGPTVRLAVLGHTRWASIGIVSEPNAHPLDERSSTRKGTSPEEACFAVLNGDVDNYADLMAAEGLVFREEITTDAKVIPALCGLRVAEGSTPAEAFRATVASFEGSVAIAAHFSGEPERMHLALRGSGQALYVGFGHDCQIVASELYGVVEETSRYLRLDGESPGNPGNPTASRGQVVTLDLGRGLGPAAVERRAYDGTDLPLAERDLRHAEMTARDVDRGGYPHFLLKEISEAPSSWAKTLRGKLIEEQGGESLRVELGEDSLPVAVRRRLADGSLRRVLVIGQGTAAVAGQAVANAIRELLDPDRVPEVRALPATELSGFGLRPEMSDVLVVAISQSGTTTDTNRTVDLVRGRGAAVLAIVNRRQSDLTDKADGVLYTSDGRDLEMSVASTKAFYSQVAAGFLLAFALADAMSSATDGEGADPDRAALDPSRQALLAALRRLPEAMRDLLSRREQIAEIARRLAPPQRYWAVVGNGANRVAAEEVRIKLSELCYKSIACDATEDKKHIDLSSEPLILVAAAGLIGSTADDVAKEVAIYRAHKAVPIVVASTGDDRFDAAAARIQVPRVHPQLDFVLAALAGHLFGYEAALAIDAQAAPLRAMRSQIEQLAAVERGGSRRGSGASTESPKVLLDVDPLDEMRPLLRGPSKEFLRALENGSYDGHLRASTAADLGLLIHTALGHLPLEGFAVLRGRPGTPAVVLDALHDTLSVAIDELTRPIDAIKHQAKTVTVGISRTDEAFLTVPLVREVLAAGVDRDRLTYGCLRTLATLDPVVREVRGHTRYRISGDPRSEHSSIRVVHSAGLSRGLASRTASRPELRGTKRSVARDGEVLVARGSADGRLFLLVPELEKARTVGLVLLHIDLAERATARSGWREAPPTAGCSCSCPSWRRRAPWGWCCCTSISPSARRRLSCAACSAATAAATASYAMR
ncbi:MAG: SIS domain-containing protein [Acidobacteria bacterium]|nr:MAG: SIS domain-containing protein [Acidobacteriota bacterium]